MIAERTPGCAAARSRQWRRSHCQLAREGFLEDQQKSVRPEFAHRDFWSEKLR